MDPFWIAILKRQFGAAVDMLENALQSCPAELWSARIWKEDSEPSKYSEFWYVAYHTLFWMDLYLSGSVESFAPPAPFSLDELDPVGLLPERVYSKDELLIYLELGRRRVHDTLETLTDEKARQTCIFSWGEVTFAELLLDNMRHIQEYGAQLNLFLGQEKGTASRWVAKARSEKG